MYARDEARIATPIGTIHLIGDQKLLHSVRIEEPDGAVSRGTYAALQQAADQLEEWFAGTRRHFSLSLMRAASPRGQALRDGMIAVAYGETASYGELARRLDSGPRAIKACARNPFPIIVPCHRIVGAGGTLGHYSGGDGAATKQWLLDHERRHLEGTSR